MINTLNGIKYILLFSYSERRGCFDLITIFSLSELGFLLSFSLNALSVGLSILHSAFSHPVVYVSKSLIENYMVEATVYDIYTGIAYKAIKLLIQGGLL